MSDAKSCGRPSIHSISNLPNNVKRVRTAKTRKLGVSFCISQAYIGSPILAVRYCMPEHEVAKINEVPEGKMKHVKAFGEDILLSNVGGTIYATSNRCGHQNASLAKGKLEGHVVTCPLHAATFDVRTGKNITGPQLMMSPEIMQKLPTEMLAMFKKTGEILSEIEIVPL